MSGQSLPPDKAWVKGQDLFRNFRFGSPTPSGVAAAVPPGRPGVYVLDGDATDRAIVLARTFGTRGRVLARPRTSRRRAISTTGCGMGAKGDPPAFRSLLKRALATSP